MAHTLSLVYGANGASSVNFLNECGTSPWCHISDGGLIINTPSKKQTWAGASFWRDGTELTMHAYQNRKIELDFEIGGTSRDAIFNMATTINRVIEDARQHQLNGMAYEVVLKLQLDTATSPIYFDVLDGDIDIPQNIMSVESLGWTKCSGNYVMKGCTLTLVCKPFGRGDEVLIVDDVGITNEDATGTNNYVTWSASAIDGDVPGPIRIAFTNMRNAVPRIAEVYVGLRDVGTPGNCKLVYEIEDGTRQGSPSLVTGTTYSGGSAYSFSLTGITSAGQKMVEWTESIYNTPIDRMGKFRVILIAQVTANLMFCAKTYYQLTELTTTEWVNPDAPGGGDLVDLGVLDLPPWPVDTDEGSAYYSFQLWAKGIDGATAGTATVDAIYLIPANDYKYRSWRYMGYNAVYLATIRDDGRRDKVADGNTAMAYIIRWKGLPLHARPNNDGKLSFLWENDTGSYNPDWDVDVSVWHTPYYLHIRGTN